MDSAASTILISGGATGIGFALAERFVQRGSEVIICGRREQALRDAQRKVPSLRFLVADLARGSDRVALADRVVKEFPKLNVLVNNAGIQRRVRFSVDVAPWAEREEEIIVNLAAPVHLTSLLLPHLAKQRSPTVVNVTSGLAFAPAAFAPVYCATKAAMHSLTVSMRHDLSSQSIEVVEIIPPAVDTDLGGKGMHTRAMKVSEFADAVMKGIDEGQREIAYGFSEKVRTASREELDALSARMSQAGGA
jgi:uncharacterized oxidoreductase